MKHTFQILIFLVAIIFINNATAQNVVVKKDSVYNSVNVQKDIRIDWLRNVQINLNKISSPYVKSYSLILVYTKSREEAMNAKKIVYTNFPDMKVFLDYTAPYFRVRAGNFQDIQEAQENKELLKTYFNNEITIISNNTRPQMLNEQ